VIKRDIIICHDADELARKAAEQFVALAGAAIARSGRFTVAAQVTFLIAGQSKRAIVNGILRSDADSFKYTAARVSPSDGQLTCLITADAMENLPIR
jgi:6-phosphogluconolactonase/glucosamine-6-phosphate isomerase/deaminase